MKSLVEFLNEGKVDYKKICNTALEAVEILKKENKDWLKHAKDETARVKDDDYFKFEDTVLNDHTTAPATWKLVVKTAELLNMDPDDLFEEVGLDPFIDVY